MSKAKRVRRSAKGSAKPRGKPFPPGNAHRWPPGKSGNPQGGGLVRPFYEAQKAYYEAHPERLTELVEVLHYGAQTGLVRTDSDKPAWFSSAQLGALTLIAKKVDREHLRDDGTDRPVLDAIEVVFEEGRGPERAPIALTKNAPKTDDMEMEFDGQPPE